MCTNMNLIAIMFNKKVEMHSLPVRVALKANLKVRLLLLHAGVRGTIGGVWRRREQRGDRREG